MTELANVKLLIAHRLPLADDVRSVPGVIIEQDRSQYEGRLRDVQPDVFIMDLDPDPTRRLDLVRRAFVIAPNAIHLVAVPPQNMAVAAEAMEHGAHGFVLTPLDAKTLVQVVKREIEHRDAMREVERLRRERPSAELPIPGATLDQIEKAAILRSLDAAGGSTGKAAKMLGISVRKIQYRLREWQEASPELFQRKGNRIVVAKKPTYS
jgi:DNA-binding NtrC family response regulator